MAEPTPDGSSETALLTLVQWLSPGFPVGAFAYSHGLEWAVAAGDLRDADDLRTWLEAVIERGLGRSDAILLAHALRPDADRGALSDLARALCASSERHRETMDQGGAFARTVSALTGLGHPPAPYPVAVGAAACGLGLLPRTVLALYLQAFASNLAAAAVRFVPLGQTEGQAALAALQPTIARVAAEAGDAPLDSIGTATVRADLAAMHHETQNPRMFLT